MKLDCGAQMPLLAFAVVAEFGAREEFGSICIERQILPDSQYPKQLANWNTAIPWRLKVSKFLKRSFLPTKVIVCQNASVETCIKMHMLAKRTYRSALYYGKRNFQGKCALQNQGYWAKAHPGMFALEILTKMLMGFCDYLKKKSQLMWMWGELTGKMRNWPICPSQPLNAILLN